MLEYNVNHVQSRTFPLTTVEMPDNRAGGDISEVKRACQPSLNDCLPLFKLNTIKTQTCNCGGAESDAVAIVWPDVCNYGAEKNVICKMYSERLRGRAFENMIWNPCVGSSFPSSRVCHCSRRAAIFKQEEDEGDVTSVCRILT